MSWHGRVIYDAQVEIYGIVIDAWPMVAGERDDPTLLVAWEPLHAGRRSEIKASLVAPRPDRYSVLGERP